SSDAVQLTHEPADNSQPTVSPDGETIAFVSNRDGTNHIWLMSKDGASERPLTRDPQSKEAAPRFLRDGSLAYLVEQKESGRTVTQVVKVDLAAGKVTPLSGRDLVVADFTVSPAGDLLGLVVAVQKNLYRVYVQPVGAAGSGAPVPIPTTGADGAGVVDAVGAQVRSVRPGDRVMINPGIPDYGCEYCHVGEHSLCVNYGILGEHRPGTLAQYVIVPEQNTAVIPTLPTPLTRAE